MKLAQGKRSAPLGTDAAAAPPPRKGGMNINPHIAPLRGDAACTPESIRNRRDCSRREQMRLAQGKRSAPLGTDAPTAPPPRKGRHESQPHTYRKSYSMRCFSRMARNSA